MAGAVGGEEGVFRSERREQLNRISFALKILCFTISEM